MAIRPVLYVLKLIDLSLIQTMKKIKLALLGIGRIGKIHFANIRQNIPNAEIVAVSAAHQLKEDFIKEYGNFFFSNNPEDVISYPDVDAVLICTSTSTHADLIEQAIARGKHVFCEKPMDLSLERTTALAHTIEKSANKVMVGFNRRFDPDMMQAKKSVSEGRIGNVQIIKITSRDPGLPSADYIKTSGGLFMDMAIHDFDMARYIMNKEVVEVFSKGLVLVDDVVRQANDVDTALTTLTFDDGTYAVIDNSRKAVYGYDQRLEIFGDKGMIQVGNNLHHHNIIYNGQGIRYALPLDFFLNRYAKSYLLEMELFVNALEKDQPMPAGVNDGLQATRIAVAAKISVQEKRPVKLEEIK